MRDLPIAIAAMFNRGHLTDIGQLSTNARAYLARAAKRGEVIRCRDYSWPRAKRAWMLPGWPWPLNVLPE